LYWNFEVTPEDEEEMIRKIAERIHKYGIDAAAILMLESFKPLSYIGSQMGRFFLSPFLPLFGDNVGLSGEKLFQIFEKRENVEKVLNMLEELTEQDKKKKEEEKLKKKAEGGESEPKKWWRRLFW
jgi:hypothetical protein